MVSTRARLETVLRRSTSILGTARFTHTHIPVSRSQCTVNCVQGKDAPRGALADPQPPVAPSSHLHPLANRCHRHSAPSSYLCFVSAYPPSCRAVCSLSPSLNSARHAPSGLVLLRPIPSMLPGCPSAICIRSIIGQIASRLPPPDS